MAEGNTVLEPRLLAFMRAIRYDHELPHFMTSVEARLARLGGYTQGHVVCSQHPYPSFGFPKLTNHMVAIS